MSLSLTLLLVLSTINLAAMIPGGFVEVRDFSRYSAYVLGSFNLFLTILGLGSVVLAYFVYTTSAGYSISAIVGVCYCAVYLADLCRIFPLSPVPMSTLLKTLEWLGTLLGIALIVVGVWAHTMDDRTTDTPIDSFAISTPVLLTLLFVGLIILAFATRAAMKKGR